VGSDVAMSADQDSDSVLGFGGADESGGGDVAAGSS